MAAVNELLDISGKVAIVTGGSRGIGEACVRRLHEAGANVVVADVEVEKAVALADELSAIRPGSAIMTQTDVSDEGQMLEMLDATLDTFGRVDILVNNAGIFPHISLAEMTTNDFMKVINVNLKGAFLGTKIVSEQLKKQGEGGKIVNITSIDAVHPSRIGLAHYDASKHGIWGFTKNAALELAQYDIAVNAVAPGGTATPGAGAVDGKPTEQHADFIPQVPMKRMGEPDEIAKVVLFVVSDMASYMTGAQVVVDGGVLLN